MGESSHRQDLTGEGRKLSDYLTVRVGAFGSLSGKQRVNVRSASSTADNNSSFGSGRALISSTVSPGSLIRAVVTMSVSELNQVGFLLIKLVPVI